VETEELKATLAGEACFLSLSKMTLCLNFVSPVMQEIRGLAYSCRTLVFQASGSIWQTVLLK